jgi:hypothetical protein
VLEADIKKMFLSHADFDRKGFSVSKVLCFNFREKSPIKPFTPSPYIIIPGREPATEMP